MSFFGVFLLFRTIYIWPRGFFGFWSFHSSKTKKHQENFGFGAFLTKVVERKPKNQKTKTLRRMFWFEVKRCFFLVLLVFFLFFLVLDLEKPKKTKENFGFSSLSLLSKVQKPKQNLVFLVFEEWKLQKPKKTREFWVFAYFILSGKLKNQNFPRFFLFF